LFTAMTGIFTPAYSVSKRTGSDGTVSLPSARDLLTRLVDTPLVTLTGRPNRILAVQQTQVVVATDRSPHGQPIPIDELQQALELLGRHGEVEITPAVVSYRSAFIGAVLRTLPGAVVAFDPPRVRLQGDGGRPGAAATQNDGRDQADAATTASLLDAIQSMRRWTRDQTEAVHKPLLLLLAFTRLHKGLPRLVRFTELEADLRALIAEFSERRSGSVHPEYPFWRLQADDLWEVTGAHQLPTRASNTDPPISALRSNQVQGGLPGHYDQLLRRRGDLLEQAVNATLDLLAPEHRGIVLARVGWDDIPPPAGPSPATRTGPVGVPYRAAKPTTPTASASSYQVDPDKVGRGLQGHQATLDALADAVRAQELVPLEPAPGGPAYDLAWETPTTIYVAEVKSLTPANAEQQLRLGLGQVLRYWHAMTHTSKPVVAVLAVEHQPANPGWRALCQRVGVQLLWPDIMAATIAQLCQQPAGRG